jgi:hypothetical protein
MVSVGAQNIAAFPGNVTRKQWAAGLIDRFYCVLCLQMHLIKITFCFASRKITSSFAVADRPVRVRCHVVLFHPSKQRQGISLNLAVIACFFISEFLMNFLEN